MSGFAAIYRDACDHPLFAGDSSRLGAWVWLIVKAAWKPTKHNISGKSVPIERGQIAVSIRGLATEWGWSKSAVDRFLTRLETETMIEREAGHGKLIITICNYDNYQSVGEDERDSSGTATGTAAGQQRDTKEQGNKGTKESPHTPQGARRGKTVIPEDWVVPAISELPPKAAECAKQWPAGKYDIHAEAFHNYWLSERKMKADWRLTWANRIVAIHDQVMRGQGPGQRGPPNGNSKPMFRQILDQQRTRESEQVS